MVAPTCFGITLPSSGSVPSAFWEMLNWGAVDRVLWMGVMCLVTLCVKRTTSLDTCGQIIRFHEIPTSHFGVRIRFTMNSTFVIEMWYLYEKKSCFRLRAVCSDVVRFTHNVTRHYTPIHNILSTAPQLSISQKALGTPHDDGNEIQTNVLDTKH
jgi:hypothetical protein